MCLPCIWLAGVAGSSPACSSKPSHSSYDTSLTVGFGIGGTALSPALDSFLDSLFAEPLISIGWNGRAQPRLATEWTVEEQATLLRLRLKPGVVFHDGTPLTAETVVPELRRNLSGSGGERIASIKADGNDHVLIRLSKPDSFLLAELSKATIRTGARRTIGTGPFVLKRKEPEAVLDSFANYHLGQPPISRIIVRTYDTARASWAAMMRGEVKFLHEINRDAVDFVEAGSRTETFSFPRPYYIPIIFNINNPILGRREVRQAINEAIDRSQIVKTALNNRGQPADGPVWPYHWSYNPSAKAYAHNPEAARLRLDAARLPVVSSTHGGMPRRFRFRCLFWSEDPLFERIALVVQKQLFEIGVDVDMVPMTLTDIGVHLRKGSFESILLPMVSGRSLEWTYLFWRSVPKDQADRVIVNSGYTAADSVLDRLRAAQSDDETRRAVADLQRVMFEDPPAAFLVRPETARTVDDSIEVPIEEDGRDILGNIWQWKPRNRAESKARR